MIDLGVWAESEYSIAADSDDLMSEASQKPEWIENPIIKRPVNLQAAFYMLETRLRVIIMASNFK